VADDLTREGSLTEDFLGQIGSRIRELRSEQGLTVQQLADRSQISRRLLTQIEHGQANPSLVAVTRIARQLGTDFTALLPDTGEAASPIDVEEPDGQVLVWTTERGSSAHLLVATSGRSADLWRWRLLPGEAYAGSADRAGSQELFYVLEGELTLSADGHEATVAAGSAARLRSDRAYGYANHGTVTTTFLRTVALTR
jgi:transcriptional regulator with XRE-family HTH domain